jgi:predicted nuclease with TOPRIM domain
MTDKENSLFELREEMDRLENEGKMDSDEYRALREQWEELVKPQPARW